MLSGVGGASAQETCFCLAVQLLCHLLLRDQPSARILSRRIPEELSRQLDILGKFTDAQMAMEEANFAQFYTCLLPATESHVLGPMVQLLMESTRLANVKLISKMYESLSLQTVEIQAYFLQQKSRLSVAGWTGLWIRIKWYGQRRRASKEPQKEARSFKYFNGKRSSRSTP